MKLVFKQLPSTVLGPARMKYLAPDAAAALEALERDYGSFEYTDFYRDPISSLLARRTRKGTPLTGYSSHGYGFGLDINIKKIIEKRQISYETLLYVMKKRGWYCHRRDGHPDGRESEHFNYLGDMAEKYLTKCTLDPTTWSRPAEERIYELFGAEFQIDLPTCQQLLSRVGLYGGETTGTLDPYTREAIMAFQRTWDLVVDGMPTTSFCRVLRFVTAEREFKAA